MADKVTHPPWDEHNSSIGVDLADYTGLMYHSIHKAGIHDDHIIGDLIERAISRVKGGKKKWDPERGAFSTYLTLVMMSVISNYFRNRRTSLDALDQGTVELDRINNKMDLSYDFQSELVNVIKESHLHHVAKRIMLLRWEHGYNLKEIAIKDGIAPATMRQRYARAVNQLQEELDEEGTKGLD